MAPRTRLLFVTLTNDVGSDRIVGDLGRAGAIVGVLGPAGSYASLSRFVSEAFPLFDRGGMLAAPFALRRGLKAAVAAWSPDRIVPLDELAATLLRAIGADGRTGPALGALITRSLGPAAGFDAVRHRVALMRTAKQAGVRVPEFATAGRDAAALRFPVLVKRDQSSGAGGVALVESPAHLPRALRGANLKTKAKGALLRLAGFEPGASPVLIQEFVEGRLAMHTVACRDGRVIDGASFVALESHPETKASTILGAIDVPELAEAGRAIVAALGCSGFVSFDFIVNDRQEAFLIEMNARPIGSTHLGRVFGHDLAHAYLTGSRAAGGPPLLPPDEAVALFPKELERDPASEHIGRAGIFHDVPENEAAVVAAYRDHLRALHPAARFDALGSGPKPFAARSHSVRASGSIDLEAAARSNMQPW